MSNDKSIETLITDVHDLLLDIEHGRFEPTEGALQLLSERIGNTLKNKLLSQKRKKERKPKTLFPSEVGKPCTKRLWYDLYWSTALSKEEQELIEETDATFLLKMCYGDILEELLLWLAEQAGHEVTHEQHEVEKELPYGWGLRGKMDAAIDGVPIDVKSASNYAFGKFREEGGLFNDDPFGYLAQLGVYAEAFPEAEQTGFYAIDKSSGELVMSLYSKEEIKEVEPDYERIIEDVSDPDNPPPRTFTDKAVGKLGNRGLVKECQFCPYKEVCWPGLRKFQYSNFVGYLTEVKKEPNVPEIA